MGRVNNYEWSKGMKAFLQGGVKVIFVVLFPALFLLSISTTVSSSSGCLLQAGPKGCKIVSCQTGPRGASDCGPARNPSTIQNVGFCDSSCQGTAPLQVYDNELTVCFNYTRNVSVIAGFMSSDFKSVSWLHADCQISADYDETLTAGDYLSCSGIEIPTAVLNEGWLFWLVTESNIAGLDWDNGIYELRFYQIDQSCPVRINGTCVNCDTDCAGIFLGDIPSIVQCGAWKDENCEPPSPGPKVAVVVGVSDYQDDTIDTGTGEPYIPDLNYADDDARSIRDLLKGSGWQVVMLTDSYATKSAIKNRIQDNIEGASKFLFCFSGHGFADDLTGYIGTYDSLYNSYINDISEYELESWLLSGGSDVEVGIILDTCHSGAFIGRSIHCKEKAQEIFYKSATKADVYYADPRAGEIFARDLAGNSWVVLTACEGDESAFERSDLEHGWLTYHLLTAFEDSNNDLNSNGFISIEEAHKEIPPLGTDQHPQLYDGNGDDDFDTIEAD